MVIHAFSNLRRLFAIAMAIYLFGSSAHGEFPKFEYHKIDEIGGRMGQTSLADVDKDGDNDVIQAEGDCKSGRIAWHENADGKGRKWRQHLILSGKRCHEAKAADVDGDGDIDICSKPWNGNEHIYLRNTLK